MSEEKDIAKQAHIRAYILEKMPPQERIDFEARLAQNTDLQEEVRLERSLLIQMNEEDWELQNPRKQRAFR